MTLKWLYFKKREVREKVFDRPRFDPKQWWNWSELVRFRDKNLMEVVFLLNRLEKNRFGRMNFVLIRFDFEDLNSFEDVLGLNITLLMFLRCFWGFLFLKNKLKNMFFEVKNFKQNFPSLSGVQKILQKMKRHVAQYTMHRSLKRNAKGDDASYTFYF